MGTRCILDVREKCGIEDGWVWEVGGEGRVEHLGVGLYLYMHGTRISKENHPFCRRWNWLQPHLLLGDIKKRLQLHTERRKTKIKKNKVLWRNSVNIYIYFMCRSVTVAPVRQEILCYKRKKSAKALE